MTEDTQPVADLSVEQLDAMLRRAIRNTLILGVLAAAAVWIASTWRDAAMLLVGMLISAASIWEWQRLARLINARLDNKRTPMGTPVVIVFFVIRLIVFAAAIYGSLKGLHGSAAALLCGLGLALITIGWEAIRLLRQ
jgi:uncharacterized membrane protein YidH (DUF202 family)